MLQKGRFFFGLVLARQRHYARHSMRPGRAILAIVASFAASPACAPSLMLEDAPCPCLGGYLCCPETGHCVSDASTCRLAPADAPSGPELRVSILGPTAVVHEQQLGPVDVQFQVDGCSDFSLIARRRREPGASSLGGLGALPLGAASPFYPLPLTDPPWHEKPARFTPAAKGTYVAHLGVSELGDAGACLGSEVAPFRGELQLRVACEGDKRTALSQRVPVRYAASAAVATALLGSGDMARLWPLEATKHVLVTSRAGLAVWHPEAADSYGSPSGRWVHDEVTLIGWTPFVQEGDVGYLAADCPLNDCGPSTTTPDGRVDVGVGYIYMLDLRDRVSEDAATGHPLIKGRLLAPDKAIAIASSDDGALTVLSAVGGEQAPQTFGLLMSRVQADTIQPMSYWPMEACIAEPRPLGVGDCAFLTQSVDPSGATEMHLRSFHDPDGLAVALPLKDNPSIRYNPMAFLAPGAEQWLVQYSNGAYLGGSSRPWAKLMALEHPIMAEWTEDLVVLSDSTHLDAFSRRDDPYKVFHQEMEGGGFSVLPLTHGHFMVSGPTTVRFLDATGRLVGGSDVTCDNVGTFSPSVELKHNLVATMATGQRAGRSWVYFFDFARYWPS
jgi:hypothetical protein